MDLFVLGQFLVFNYQDKRKVDKRAGNGRVVEEGDAEA